MAEVDAMRLMLSNETRMRNIRLRPWRMVECSEASLQRPIADVYLHQRRRLA